ncbi:MAG: 4-hydroxythreonine-4-phosphate dehydrogenase PdxA [Bacteroidetes bacterium]|nr:4-hydroxythreonine-4-phosphate dehydrogenase PdxA [Bacteroidota bacterium]MCW5897491.1 4-hydroxythreonine-4-phosphate dehydrogenase PdxA [Bacteroidota bacterium]
MRNSNKPVIAITVGDFNSIGPEVTLKSLRAPAVRKACRIVLIGPREVYSYYSGQSWFDPPTGFSLIETPSVSLTNISPGTLSKQAGATAAFAIEAAVRAVQSGIADAIVTAPVSKQALHLAGIDVPGQTEMVQHLSNSPKVAMMLVSQTMRVGLVTIHVPIKNVASMITKQLLRERIAIIHSALRTDWRIRKPKLAVLGLNPHASEGGDIGNEDVKIVAPVVKEFQKKGMNIEGPFPADAFFGTYKPGIYDGIVAMYHDQGLIPLKMSSFGKAVNISVGLNIVRTSPDHGTAFDIAGKGIANPGSMIEAIMLAAQVVQNRRYAQKAGRT